MCNVIQSSITIIHFTDKKPGSENLRPLPQVTQLFKEADLGFKCCQYGSSQSWRKSILNIHWKDWCWSWSSSTLATWCEEPTHWKRPWCWERLRAEEEGSRRWDDWCHHQLNGREFEQILGGSEEQPPGHKELDTEIHSTPHIASYISQAVKYRPEANSLSKGSNENALVVKETCTQVHFKEENQRAKWDGEQERVWESQGVTVLR